MPLIEDLLNGVGQSKIITTLNLAKGYWQVPVATEDKHKTAFTSPKGLYHFNTMPFGLRGAPATFQRLMDKILRGTKSFTGMTLIHSLTWDEHLRQLRDVLTHLQDAGLTLKLKTCLFGAVDCEYLEHKIDRGGVLPVEGKVRAIKELCRPKSK